MQQKVNKQIIQVRMNKKKMINPLKTNSNNKNNYNRKMKVRYSSPKVNNNNKVMYKMTKKCKNNKILDKIMPNIKKKIKMKICNKKKII